MQEHRKQNVLFLTENYQVLIKLQNCVELNVY